MDARERVLASINHKRPDRIPADLWAEPSVWERLVKDLGAGSEEGVRNALQIDVRYVSPIYPADTITSGVKQNMWGERWEKTSTVYGYEWEHTRGALFHAQSLADLEAFPWLTCDQVDYSTIAERVRRYDGYAIFYGNADFFERPGLVLGLENILVDVMVNQDMVDYLQERFLPFLHRGFLQDHGVGEG